MKSLFLYAHLAAFVSAAPWHQERDLEDDSCSMVWVTVYGDAPSETSTAGSSENGAIAAVATSSTSIGTSASITNGIVNEKAKMPSPEEMVDAGEATSSMTLSSATATKIVDSAASDSSLAISTPDESSALQLPNRPDGSAPIPINDDHIKAPVAKDAVPAGAAIYHPLTPNVFNNTDFATWMTSQKTAKLASKWLIVAPGTYRYALGPQMPSGTDPNTIVGENIAIGFMPGGWALDLRGVTFVIDITPENQDQRPAEMIYLNQSENFTILGGTIWIDQGEEWTQARVMSLSAPDSSGNQIATMEVEQGYNLSTWRTAGPRNQGCVDDSNPNHYTRPACNFWYVSNYDFSDLDSKRAFTFQTTSRVGIEKGYVITMEVVINFFCAIATENNGALHVKGMTSNGAVSSYGLRGKVPPIFEDVYYVNPPPRPGYAPRVNGPALSWGNIGGFVYNAGGEALAQLPGSYWQTSGSVSDLQAASNGTVPN